MRFSLKQILLLFLLLGILGGLFSAAIQMPAPYRLEKLVASPDGKLLCGGTTNHWFLFDLERGEQIQANGMTSSFAFQFGRGPVAFLNNDEILFSERIFGLARSLSIWSIKRREFTREQENVATSVTMFGSEAIDVGPKYVASLTSGDNMRSGSERLSSVSIFERDGLDRVPIQLALPYELSSVSVDLSGKLLAMGCRGGDLNRIWDLESNSQVHEWDERVIRVLYSPTEPQLLVAQRNRLTMRSPDGLSDLWEIETQVRTDELALQFSNDGRRVVFQAGYEEPLLVLNATDGSLISEIDLTGYSRVYEQTPLALSHDGNQLFVAGKRADYGISVFDTSTGKMTKRLGRVNRLFSAVVFVLLLVCWPVAWRWFGSEAEDCEAAVQQLVACRDRFPSLRALFIGDIVSEECEVCH